MGPGGVADVDVEVEVEVEVEVKVEPDVKAVTPKSSLWAAANNTSQKVTKAAHMGPRPASTTVCRAA